MWVRLGLTPSSTANPREAKAAAASCAGSEGQVLSCSHQRAETACLTAATLVAPNRPLCRDGLIHPGCVGATYRRSVLPAAARLCSGVHSTQIYVRIHTEQSSLTWYTATPHTPVAPAGRLVTLGILPLLLTVFHPIVLE